MIPLLLASSLYWLPSQGSGLNGEFLFQTKASALIVIFNKTLNGNSACYLSVDTSTPKIYVYRDSTLSWREDGIGDRCTVRIRREDENGEDHGDGDRDKWFRLFVTFVPSWKGVKGVYAQENGPEILAPVWYRAGIWNAEDELVASLPPIPPIPSRLESSFVPVINSLKPDALGRYPGDYPLIFRNGILQSDKMDFNSSDGLILPLTPWDAGDIVTGIAFVSSIRFLVPPLSPALSSPPITPAPQP